MIKFEGDVRYTVNHRIPAQTGAVNGSLPDKRSL